MDTPDLIFWSCFVFGFVSFLWELYLSVRQYRKHVETKERPAELENIIDEESFKKARLYHLDTERFNFASSIWSAFENTIILLFNLIYVFWNYSGHMLSSWGYSNEILHSLLFLTLVSLLDHVINVPWTLYKTFVIEQKHGFNKQTLGFFVKDQIKKLALTMVLGLPITASLLWIIQKGGDYFFIFVWVFLLALTFFLMTIYPEFIAPLFDKYTPLQDGELKTKIENLASKLNFPLKKLYIVEGSKRSAHSNAYLYGFWNNKRIVLFDTLIADYSAQKEKGDKNGEKAPEKEQAKDLVEEVGQSEQEEKAPLLDDVNGDWEKPDLNSGSLAESKPTESTETEDQKGAPEVRKKLGMSNDEIVAVLGHELGHWKLNHTLYNLIVLELNTLLCLTAFSLLYKWPALYAAFGFAKTQPILIGLLIIFSFVFSPYNEVISFIMTCWSRRCEFAADHFSAQLGYADLLKSSLVKLGKDNLSFPVDDRLYSAWHHSHPPAPERIEALKKFE